jgi:Flp pilus assembly protein TadD
MRMNINSYINLSLIALGSLYVITFSGCSTMSAHTSNRIGMAHYQTGNYTMAQQEFKRAIAEGSHNPNYYHNMASAMHKSGNLAGAEQAYRQALTVDPTHQPSYHSMAQLLNEQSRSTESQQLMQTWVATQPENPSSYVEMAWLQKETGDLAGAETSLRQALKVRPNHPIATAQLGQIYESRGDQGAAVAMYQRSLFSKWNQPQVQKRMVALKKQNRNGNQNRLAMNSPWNGNPQITTAQGMTPQYQQTVSAPSVNGQTINDQTVWMPPTGMPTPAEMPVQNADPAHMSYPVQAAGVQPNGNPQ